MNARKKIYIIIIFFLILLLIIFALGVPVLMKRIIAVSGELIKSEQILADSYQEENDVVIVERDYQELKLELDKLEKGLFRKEQVLDFISAVKAVAKETGVSCDIKISGQGSGDRKTGLTTVIFQVYSSGAFPSLIRFLKGLEAMPYFVQLDSIQVSQNSTKATEGGDNLSDSIGANLSMQVYSKQ
jgi:Tfp pilus assembly protein PilO